MKIINVSAAIIIKDNKIFITQRGYGEFKDMWEFPGGKIEADESPENAIIREIKEELNSTIKPLHFLGTIEYDYPSFHLVMHNFICQLINGDLDLLEHEDAKFVTKNQLSEIEFLPADILVLDLLNKYLVN